MTLYLLEKFEVSQGQGRIGEEDRFQDAQAKAAKRQLAWGQTCLATKIKH